MQIITLSTTLTYKTDSECNELNFSFIIENGRKWRQHVNDFLSLINLRFFWLMMMMTTLQNLRSRVWRGHEDIDHAEMSFLLPFIV